eukprot:jgi/Botrbrau1/21871/Bobra.0249s0002.1
MQDGPNPMKASTGPAAGGKAKQAASVVKVIPLSRANNISIMLTQFSNFKGPRDIRRAVITGKGLSLERLSLLLQIAPKEDELKALQRYTGSFQELSPPEQFLSVMSSVPRLNSKLNLLILVQHFDTLLQSAESAVSSVDKACQQIRNGVALEEVLKAVLAVGNTLNAGTNRGCAQGIKLDSLMKLADVKATKSKTTSPAKEAQGKASAPAQKANGEDESGKSSVPEVTNVLEFVAWLVGSGRSSTVPQSAWLNGRGGFLADELPAVREASIRIQGEMQETLRNVEMGVTAAESEYEAASAAGARLVRVCFLVQGAEKAEDSARPMARALAISAREALAAKFGAKPKPAAAPAPGPPSGAAPTAPAKPPSTGGSASAPPPPPPPPKKAGVPAAPPPPPRHRRKPGPLPRRLLPPRKPGPLPQRRLPHPPQRNRRHLLQRHRRMGLSRGIRGCQTEASSPRRQAIERSRLLQGPGPPGGCR